MASGKITTLNVYTTGVTGSGTKQTTFPTKVGQIIFLSRSSVNVVGFIMVDMLSEISRFGTDNFLSLITATISNNQITITNNTGVALQCTVIAPSDL